MRTRTCCDMHAIGSPLKNVSHLEVEFEAIFLGKKFKKMLMTGKNKRKGTKKKREKKEEKNKERRKESINSRTNICCLLSTDPIIWTSGHFSCCYSFYLQREPENLKHRVYSLNFFSSVLRINYLTL